MIVMAEASWLGITRTVMVTRMATWPKNSHGFLITLRLEEWSNDIGVLVWCLSQNYSPHFAI
ncbi:MAG: hypothetical protein GY808_04160 [Gammaproteobacteria bacterium]|nr:hypothetical protein [Gammaproteobacteria bacterium]